MFKWYFNLESRLNLFLYVGFFIVILLMATSLFIMINSNTAIKKQTDALHSKQFEQTVKLLKLEQNLTLSFAQLSAFLITGQQEDKNKFDEAINQVGNSFLTSFDEYYRLDKSIADIIKRLDKYHDESRDLIAISKDRRRNYIGITRANELLGPYYLQIISIFEQLIDNQLNKEDEAKLELLSSLVKCRSSWFRMVMSLRVYLTTLGQSDYQQFLLYSEQNKKDFKNLFVLKEKFDFDALFLSDLEQAYSAYMNHLPEVLTLFREEKWRQDIFILKTKIYPLMSNVLGQIRLVVKQSENNTEKKISAIQTQINTQVKVSKWIFIISIIIAIAIVIVVGRNISVIARLLTKSQHEASNNLIKANDRAQELEFTSKELQNSIHLLNTAQEQLVETEKMAALGGLVAGVAHEINTPIGISITSSSFLNDELAKLKEQHNASDLTEEDFLHYIEVSSQSTDIITSNLKRAATLISSFKQIAVDQSSEEHRKFNLRIYLDEIVISLTPKIKTINVNIDCSDKIELNSYPGVFSQIITNLILNSKIHGFENHEDGEINIQVTEISESSGAKAVQLDYRDNGVGMSEEVKQKVFEPFFTTKRDSGGSGIGMSLVYNLITQKLGGQLSVESQPGQGVHFTMVIPNEVIQYEEIY